MRRLAAMTLLALTLITLGQVAVQHQPDLVAMKAAVTEARAKRPADSATLLALKGAKVDASLADDLKKFDWFQAGAWSYPEKSFTPSWREDAPSQFDFRRYLDDGSELSYSFSINLLDPSKAEVRHVNFDSPAPMSVAIKKVGKDTYLEVTAFGDKELQRVRSYEHGVLIIDISYDGKVNSKTVKFRDVRIAMPRLFESTGK
jgi:hypothetical protein